MNRKSWLAIVAIGTLLSAAPVMHAAPRKAHVVVLGAARKVAYSKVGDPAGALAGETELRVRALVVDGAVKEWTTGDAHDVTDRSFVVRRAIKLNDSLPSEAFAPIGTIPRSIRDWRESRRTSSVKTGDKPATSDKALLARSLLRAPSRSPERGGALGLAARSLAAGGSRDGAHRRAEAARLRSRREPGGLVPRLRGLLRRDGQRQEPLRGRCAGGGAQGCAGQKALGLRCGEPSGAGLRTCPSGSASR